MTTTTPHQLGIVIIGRNEGERLRACFDSLAGIPAQFVYVDSSTTSDSIELAKSRGIDVVKVDDSGPLTAARSRNLGVARLKDIAPDVDLVQFIDGDCTIAPGWITAAIETIDGDALLAVVCGRRRERFPDQSIYNRLCDMEWNTPVGPARACGGDSLVRLIAFDEVGGFNSAVIAGEEPELCVRICEKGWGIVRIDHEMTLHDARMTRFSQWWKRMVRSGHAYAEGMAMHGSASIRFNVREVISIVAWALVIPLLAIGMMWWTRGWSLLLLGLFGVLWLRVLRGQLRREQSRYAIAYSTFCVVGKWAQMQGVAQYWLNRLRGRRTKLIEYKGAELHEPVLAVPLSEGEQ